MMGLMCSWVAVRGVAKGPLLEALQFEETGEQGDLWKGIPKYFCSERPNGWTVVFSNHFEWANPARVLELSRHGEAVGCQFEDKVEMTSLAFAARDGEEVWRVFHVNDEKNSKRLDVTGDPPRVEELKAEFFKLQEEKGDAEDVDYVHEIPLEVAKSACGYRLDEDESTFHIVQPIGGEPPKRGFFASLFGRR